MPIPNKYHTYCHRCNKELQAGEGYCIPRNRGKYEVICSTECLMTNLRMPDAMMIEIRIKIPQISGVSKEEAYRIQAENILVSTLKEHFADYKTKFNQCRSTKTSGIDENGVEYYGLIAYIKNVIQRNKKHLIIYGE